MHLITGSPANALDRRWYTQLTPLLLELGETFVALMPSDDKLTRARQAFVASGYQENPELHPDRIDADTLLRIKTDLFELQSNLHDNETTAEIRELYDERIKESIANIYMIVAASAGNKDEFLHQNKLIYGLPDAAIFAAACAWIRQDAAMNYQHVGDDLRNEILDLVPAIKGDASALLPNDEVFQNVKDAHFQAGGYIDQLFSEASVPDMIITSETGDAIVRQVIANVGSDFALADSPSGLWAVLQSQRQVVRPSDLALNKRAFMGIVAHEVGSHLLESTNGERSALKLLELGLDRYECGNEGRAFLREQIMYDHIQEYVDQPHWRPTKASWEYRIAIHLIISLASGLAGRNYDFAELYHLLTVLFRFWTAKRGEEIDETAIHDGAWSMAVRALKGTDGQGGAYLKDIVYLEGNIRCWRAAKENPNVILSGDIGKFDIASTAHATRLKKLGILPRD